MNMLDIGGGFTGTEFQLEEVNIYWNSLFFAIKLVGI
jgi:hypothetical protein